MIKYLLVLLLLVLPLISHARDIYVLPGGSGDDCTFGSPCTLDEGRSQAFAGDTVWLKNGTYNYTNWGTIRAGTSGKYITFQAVNRHQAIFNYTGPYKGCSPQENLCQFEIRHSWIIMRGLRIDANTNAWNGMRIFGAQEVGTAGARFINNVIFEDNYVHDAANLLIWVGMTNSPGAEIRYNTFDRSGVRDKMGEANYWGASHDQRPGVVNTHHNIFSNYKANCVDFKGEYRDGNFHDNICMDHDLWTGSDDPNDSGDGTFVIGCGEGDACNQVTATNNFIRDNLIFRPRSATIFAGVDPVRVSFIGNVVVDYIGSHAGVQNLNASDMETVMVSHSNIQCPSQGVNAGEDISGSNPNNLVNRPMAECNTRIDEIVGKPVMSSCNIGSINDNTVTVNIQTTKNGPVSWIEFPLEVTYNGTNQTGEATTLFSGNQARISVVTPPANDAVTVRVVAATGAIHNSAFIGGKDCTNQDDFDNPNYIRGAGFCGENTAQTLICTNTTEGEGPPPVTEALDQAIWRFYAMNNAEGVSPMAPENTNITSRIGGEFRWRVGVRGGGNDSPSRSYALAARVCKPACGPWSVVSEEPSVGLVFFDDQIQDDGTVTTNQLSLGGKTFKAGHFLDQPASTDATTITTTQQIEWEFGLQIPTENSGVEIGDTIELRIQHDDGTVLSAYTLPSITVLGSGPASYGGKITGSIR